MELVSDRRYRFPVPPDRFWAAISATDRYRDWWPWLRVFDAEGLHAGASWRCAVRAPWRYTVRFRVALTIVEPPRLIDAHLDGDLDGTARLTIGADERGCAVRLTSTLSPSTRGLWLITSLARPIARRGHDWILDTGARQFATAALAPTDS